MNRLGRQSVLRIDVYGRSLFLRTASTDYTVAVSTFSGEFKSIAGMFDRNVTGLIVDAGGYIGTAAIALSEMFPKAKVVSIEASEENFEMLKRNIEGHPNIVAINAALMAATAEKSVTFVDRGEREWGFAVKTEKDDSAKVLGTVSSISMEQIMEDFGFDEIMICKMDIEGAERDVLRDSKDWIDKVKVLVLELHDRFVPGCRDAFLESSRERFVFKDTGEKFISVGKSMFKN